MAEPAFSSQPEAHPPTSSSSEDDGGGKRYKALTIILIVFAILGVVGFFVWLNRSRYEDTDDAFITGHIHPVSSRVGGTITRVLVDNNQQVKAGQLLVVLDPKDYEVALSKAVHDLDVAKARAETAQSNIPYTERQATAQVTQAQAGVGVSQTGVTQSEQAVNEAQAKVASAQDEVQRQEADYRNAQINYQRYAGANPEAISAQQLDQARTTMQVSEAALNAARAQLAQAQARLAQAQSNVSTSAKKVTQSRGVFQGANAQRLQVNVVKNQYQSELANVETAQDAVDQAKLNLAYTRIFAPVSGRVGQRTAEVGQRVQPGDPMMSIVSPEIWVVANFKETQLRRMKPGQPVEIRVDAYKDHPFKGYVDSIAPASGAQFALLPPENATGNYTKTVQRVPVKIVFDPKSIRGYEDRLVPGLSVVPRVNVSVNPERGRHGSNR